MKIVTTTQVSAVPNPDEEGPKLITEVRHDANVQTDEEAEKIFDLRAMKDHRVLNCRIFELELSEDGTPTVGKERL